MTSLAVDPFPLFAWLDTGKQFKAATKIVPDRRASAHEEGWFQRVVCEALKVRENSGIVCKRNQHAVLLCHFIIVGFSSAMKIYSAGFLKTWLPPNRPLPSNHSQKVANIKTKNASIAVSLPFLSSSSLFPLLVWLLSLSGAENLPFGPFSLKWLQISLGSLSKTRLETICKRLKCWKKTLLLVRYGCTPGKRFIKSNRRDCRFLNSSVHERGFKKQL